jgi:TrmH family RNA methyltransferase
MPPSPNYNRLLPLETKSVDVVLVSPRNPLNVGAAARAMANFGFAHLTVVAPYAPHWREARSAVGAPELLQNAKESLTLAEAVAGCTLVVGTGTRAYRKPEQKLVPLPALPPLIQNELKRGGRVALVFGPEKHGLTREDLSWCHLLVEIPTDAQQPSMNLGQAVAVCLYELATRTFTIAEKFAPAENHKGIVSGHDFSRAANAIKSGRASAPAAKSPIQPEPIQPAAPSASLDLLAEVIEETMLSARYSPPSMQAANRHDLRLLLRRLAPNQRDSRRILGLFRRILWRLKQTQK